MADIVLYTLIEGLKLVYLGESDMHSELAADCDTRCTRRKGNRIGLGHPGLLPDETYCLVNPSQRTALTEREGS